MEIDRTDAAQDALEQAAKAAPDWEAVHYERGKLFLRRRGDVERGDPRPPIQLTLGKIAHPRAHAAPFNMRRPASTRDWKFT